MLIAQIEPPHTTRGGDWYYRTSSPGSAMAEHEDVFVVDLTNVHRRRDAVLQQADLVIFNMVCDPDLLPILAERSSRGQPTVYEVNDDVACMQPWNPAAGFYANPDHQILFRMLIRACAAAQFCTPELERIYGRLNARTILFPNQMARPAAERAPRPGRRPTVIGWGGSVGHFQDVAEIAGPLTDWISNRDDVVLHLMCADRIWALFDRLDAAKKRRFETGTIDDYHAFVGGLDIGLAPIENTGFNRCRSDVKFLEYALNGAIPVVRALAPYERTVEHRATGMLFHNTDELLAILDELLREAALRVRIAEQARRYVVEQRSERLHAPSRIAFYRSLFPGSGSQAGSGASGSGASLFKALSRIEGAQVSGRHITLEATRYELLLHDALVVGQMDARRRDAEALLREAAKLEPAAYQPHLFGAAMSARPVDWLKAALKRNPKSLKAHVLLAEKLADLGQIQPSLSSLLAAAEIHPAYDVPYARLAEFMERWNQPTEAKSFFEAAATLRRPYVEPFG